MNRTFTLGATSLALTIGFSKPALAYGPRPTTVNESTASNEALRLKLYTTLREDIERLRIETPDKEIQAVCRFALDNSVLARPKGMGASFEETHKTSWRLLVIPTLPSDASASPYWEKLIGEAGWTAFYEPGHRILVIKPARYSRKWLLGIVMHELFHAWQHKRGILPEATTKQGFILAEYHANSFHQKVLLQIGSNAYRQYLVKEVAKLKAWHAIRGKAPGTIVPPKPGYDKELDTIFDKVGSPREQNNRLTVTYIHKMFQTIDETDKSNRAINKKSFVLYDLYRSLNLGPAK